MQVSWQRLENPSPQDTRLLDRIIAPLRNAYWHAKIIVGKEDQLTIMNRSLDTGAMEKTRYRLAGRREFYIWVNDD